MYVRTQRTNRRTRTQRPPTSVHRHAYVYVIPVEDPRTRTYEEYGYIGQTARTYYTGNPRIDLVDRYLEHKADQPWADQIRSPGMLVIWQGSCTQAELDARERTAIRTYRPLYNIEHNRRNPRRIKPWEVRKPAARPDIPTYIPYLAAGFVLAAACLSLISRMV